MLGLKLCHPSMFCHQLSPLTSAGTVANFVQAYMVREEGHTCGTQLEETHGHRRVRGKVALGTGRGTRQHQEG